MYCQYCKSEIVAGDRQCRHCGAPVEAAQSAAGQSAAGQSAAGQSAAGQSAAGQNPEPEIWGDKPGKKKKPLLKRWWFWLIACLIAAFAAFMLIGENAMENTTNKTYILGAGYYQTDIDIPAGVCDITAVSGNGNLSTANTSGSGVNELMGIDDGAGIYTQSLQGVEVPRGVTLSINGTLTVQLTYTDIDSLVSGRTYDQTNAITLESGAYLAGTDFLPGVYQIVAVSGTGNLSSSNVYNGGVNEAFGIEDGSGIYTQKVTNVDLPEGVKLRISEGLTVKLIPALTNPE